MIQMLQGYFTDKQIRQIECAMDQADVITRAAAIGLLLYMSPLVTPKESVESDRRGLFNPAKEVKTNFDAVLLDLKNNNWKGLCNRSYFHNMRVYEEIIMDVLQEADMRSIYDFLIYQKDEKSPSVGEILDVVFADNPGFGKLKQSKFAGSYESGFYMAIVYQCCDHFNGHRPLVWDEKGRFDTHAWNTIFKADIQTHLMVDIIMGDFDSQFWFTPSKYKNVFMPLIEKNDWEELCDVYFSKSFMTPEDKDYYKKSDPWSLTHIQMQAISTAFETMSLDQQSAFMDRPFMDGTIGDLIGYNNKKLGTPFLQGWYYYCQRSFERTGLDIRCICKRPPNHPPRGKNGRDCT